MRVALVAGLTNGHTVYRYLARRKSVDLVLTITNPDGSGNPRHVDFPDLPYVVKTGSVASSFARLEAAQPDLIMVAGWSEMLDERVLSLPKLGVIGFHPSRLPAHRGRSVLAWQIEEGVQDSALTMFYYDRLPDAGDIIGQFPIRIEANDYIADVLDKCDSATESLMRAYFPLIRKGIAPRTPQHWGAGTLYRLRDNRDSLIDWNSNSTYIYNKIRAISRPYPGAEAWIGGNFYRIWRAEIASEFPWGHELPPGSLVARLHDDSMIVRCRDGFVRVQEASCIPGSAN